MTLIQLLKELQVNQVAHSQSGTSLNFMDASNKIRFTIANIEVGNSDEERFSWVQEHSNWTARVSGNFVTIQEPVAATDLSSLFEVEAKGKKVKA